MKTVLDRYAFVSYAHADSSTVVPLIETLSLSHHVWYDDGIPTSNYYDEVIAKKISDACCVIAFITKNYDTSEYCRNELLYALDERKAIVPVYLDRNALTGGLKMRLTHIQGIVCKKDEVAGRLSDESVLDPCKKASDSWGPERPTFTLAPVTFNSVSNNPTIGDERNFVRVKEYGADGPYMDSVDIEVGKEYEVWIYYHNCADPILMGGPHSMALNVAMSAIWPEELPNGSSGVVKCKIMSTNANPNEIWDTAYLRNDNGTVYLRYVANSATLHNGGSANGSILDGNSFLSSDRGAKLAHNDSDGYWGIIPAGYDYAGYVTFRIKVDKPGFRGDMLCARDGSDDFRKEIDAKPGDIVKLKISYNNIGTTNQLRVCVYLNSIDDRAERHENDQPIDDSVKRLLVPGTQVAATPKYPLGVSVSDVLADGPMVIGDFHPGEEATVSCKVRVPFHDGPLYVRSSIATANGTAYLTTIIHVVS